MGQDYKEKVGQCSSSAKGKEEFLPSLQLGEFIYAGGPAGNMGLDGKGHEGNFLERVYSSGDKEMQKGGGRGSSVMGATRSTSININQNKKTCGISQKGAARLGGAD